MLHPAASTKTIVYTLAQLPDTVRRLMPVLLRHKVIALHGDLGAGKTTFTAALCRLLKTTEQADSPTFSLINQYTFKSSTGQEETIFHTDWYRIKDEEEARMAGIEDLFNQPFALCLIEWPEKAPGLLPEDVLHLWFHLGDHPEMRKIVLSAGINGLD